MRFRLLLLLLFISVLHTTAQDDTTLLKTQKRLVAQLSGATPITDGTFISHRSTKEERKKTIAYLSQEMKMLGLIPTLQNYRLPNVNPIVDLLVNPFKGTNVYTILPATTQSDQYIVLGAHLDSERNCPGAIDNATGIAICYGAVAKLSQLKERTMNVILVYFDQEEEELCGSQSFAKMLIAEKYDIHSVHTLDTIGWDRDGDSAVELGVPSDLLAKSYQAAGAKLGIPIHITGVNASDNYSFIETGFDATGLTDELVNGDFAPYKDTEKDTYDTVNFKYVESSTKLVYEVFKTFLEQ